MRLIDADDYCRASGCKPPFGNAGGCANCIICDCPTVDAEPVRHGRWIFKHNPITDPKSYFIRIVCSECNLHTGQKSNYCPKCGAKMDQEAET